ncbi:MAG: universal stress protein [Chloroflexi bacterium]|nr:universal stress protein [Chloroflexota bacterium]
MLTRILVPTDGSPFSDRAIPLAQAVASSQGGEVLLVQVVELPVLAGEGDSYAQGQAFQQTFDLLQQLARANLERLSARFRGAGILVESSQLLGNAAESLLDFEKEHDPDLVVMATHGRSGVLRFALGSVADRMIRHGTAPVLLVRNEPEEPTLEKALVMLDGSGVAEEALEIAKVLAGHPLHQVELLQVVSDPRDRGPAATYLQGVARQFATTGIRTTIRVEIGDPRVIIEAESHDVDLVILCTHGRGGIDRFRHGSVAESVVRQSTKPVLLVRAAA